MINIIEKINNIAFFYERAISIFIFLIFLFAISMLIKKENSYKRIKYLLIVYLIILSIMAYFVIPAPAHDLYRLYIDMHKFDGMSWSKLLSTLFTNIRFSRDILYFIVCKLGHDGFLPMFATLIFYSCIFHIIYDYSKQNNISGRSISRMLVLFMLMGQYGDVVFGIRSTCCFGICSLCIYKELYQKKSIIYDLPLYFIALGLHSVSVPIIIMRVFLLLFQNENKIYKKIINISLFAGLIYFVYKNGSLFINEALEKGTSYANSTDSIDWLKWELLITSLILIIYLLLIVRGLHLNIQRNFSGFKSYNIMFLLFFILVIAAFFIEKNTFVRFTKVVTILGIPYILSYFESLPLKTKKNHILKYDLDYYCLLVLVAIFEISRGALCGLKFFIFK